MAGAPYLRHLAAAELAGETRSRLRGEDRALRAAHQERRTPDLPDGVPELLEVGLQPSAADRGIELVGPAAVGQPSERVPPPLADVLLGAPRVEGAGPLDRLLEGGEVALRELGADRLAARGGDRRGDV